MTGNLDTSIRMRAFAKINLGLKIIGRRPDHYHELRTVLQTVSLHDRLEVNRKRQSRSIEVLCDAPGLPEGADNLVYRACELWRRWRGLRTGLAVRIEKAIPAGSGLGGASTDAFATILGLERITGDRMPEAARLHLASQLGSDVPFFHWGGRAFAVGRGDEVHPLSDLPSRYCLIVYPSASISTADAYRRVGARWEADSGTNRRSAFAGHSHFSLEKWGPVENDFESVVYAKGGKMRRIKKALQGAGADLASLSGSGSAVFGIFKTSSGAEEALRGLPSGWPTFKTRTLNRASYQKAQVVSGTPRRRPSAAHPGSSQPE